MFAESVVVNCTSSGSVTDIMFSIGVSTNSSKSYSVINCLNELFLVRSAKSFSVKAHNALENSESST